MPAEHLLPCKQTPAINVKQGNQKPSRHLPCTNSMVMASHMRVVSMRPGGSLTSSCPADTSKAYACLQSISLSQSSHGRIRPQTKLCHSREHHRLLFVRGTTSMSSASWPTRWRYQQLTLPASCLHCCYLDHCLCAALRKSSSTQTASWALLLGPYPFNKGYPQHSRSRNGGAE